MEQNTGQENDVVEDGGDLVVVRQQPAQLENVLMQPALDMAKQDEQQPQSKD